MDRRLFYLRRSSGIHRLVLVEDLKEFFQRYDGQRWRQEGLKLDALVQDPLIVGNEEAAAGLSGFADV